MAQLLALGEDQDVDSYARPTIIAPVFHDADGRLIDYGRRWEGSPPEDSYSVDSNPQRFAPLLVVAEALIAHLRSTYDVELIENAESASDLLHPRPDVVRAVRVRPRDPACAALTFVLTSYPGVILHAGVLHDFPFPVCGCDACDSTWDAEAEALERTVQAVVTGNYRESIDRGIRPWVGHALTYRDGSSSGTARAQDLPPARVKAARTVLRARPGQPWAAWRPMAADS